MKKKSYNLYEENCMRLHEDVRTEKERLLRAARDVITKQNVINLYPEGPDKQKAIKDCEEAKYHLICVVGAYDARRQEAINYIKENYDNVSIVFRDKFLDSHEIIEFAYEYYYKK